MSVVRVYSNLIAARQAADYLLVHGIPAFASAPFDAMGNLNGFPVSLRDAAYLPAARSLLAEFESAAAVMEPGWESQSTPDLSKLPPEIVIPCPQCRAPLPRATDLKRCPACGSAVEVVEIIVGLYGPEALAPCFPDERLTIPPDVLDTATLFCPECQYDLLGLPARGLCPECGREYSKADILRGP